MAREMNSCRIGWNVSAVQLSKVMSGSDEQLGTCPEINAMTTWKEQPEEVLADR